MHPPRGSNHADAPPRSTERDPPERALRIGFDTRARLLETAVLVRLFNFATCYQQPQRSASERTTFRSRVVAGPISFSIRALLSLAR